MGYSLSIIGASESYNAANNTSTVSITARLSSSGGYSYYGLGAYVRWYINIGGASTGWQAGPGTLGLNSSWDFGWSYTFQHDANGYRGAVGTYAYIENTYNSTGLPFYLGTSGPTYGAIDYSRVPTATTAPTYDARVSGSTNIKMYSSGTLPGGSPAAPSITSFDWVMKPNGSSTGQTAVTAASPFTWSSADIATDYLVTAAARNSEGAGAVSSGTWMYAAPYISAINLPAMGVVGKAYSGTIAGTKVDSYSIVSGSLPPGLSVSGSSIVGTPTLPGIYTFKIRATRTGVSYVDSPTQTIQILAGGPWVNLGPTPWTTNTVTNVSVSNNVATITTGTNHGLAELNQPIKISGITGAQSWLNGDWIVTSWTNNTLSFAATQSNLASTSVSGTLDVVWKRTSIYVYNGTTWVQAYMRTYDVNTGTWKYTA